jgi:hypothetical protein
MAERAVHHLELALRRRHWLKRLFDAKAPKRNGRRARGYLRALIFGLAAMSPVASMGHAPSLQECFEGGDFIANAAQARDHGMPKSIFIDRLVADVYAIQAFPPELRWFVVDPQDAEFLLAEASQVFDRPLPPEAHRAEFLSRCFDR